MEQPSPSPRPVPAQPALCAGARPGHSGGERLCPALPGPGEPVCLDTTCPGVARHKSTQKGCPAKPGGLMEQCSVFARGLFRLGVRIAPLPMDSLSRSGLRKPLHLHVSTSLYPPCASTHVPSPKGHQQHSLPALGWAERCRPSHRLAKTAVVLRAICQQEGPKWQFLTGEVVELFISLPGAGASLVPIAFIYGQRI